MAGVEQPCYTLINFPTDSEPYNEMQLKLDLGKLKQNYSIVIFYFQSIIDRLAVHPVEW